MGSISLEKAGPIARIVLLPALIWVCPASSTKYVFIPIFNFYNFFFISRNSTSVGHFTTILGHPEPSQAFSLSDDLSSNFAYSSICIYAPITACPTWAHTFPFPIFKLLFTTNNIFGLIGFSVFIYIIYYFCFYSIYIERSAFGPYSIIFTIISAAIYLLFVYLIALWIFSYKKPNYLSY